MNDVQDKARFEEICRAHGFPCVPTLAVFDHGASKGEENLRTWTEPLFVKALSGNRGVAPSYGGPAGEGSFLAAVKNALSTSSFNLCASENCIVQPVLEDHAGLKALETVALSNVRIVTAKGTSIPSTPIAAAMSLAVEAASLTGHEGIHCGIDIDRGTIIENPGIRGRGRSITRTGADGFCASSLG